MRLMNAEQLLSNEKADKVAAIERHVKRTQEIEDVNHARFVGGRIPVPDLAEARYYRLQAELWLEQERAK